MTEDEDYDALSQKHLSSIKRDMRISWEDAAVRAAHKVMAELGEEHMTWVFLTNKKRNEISHKSGPYVADCFAPHEAEVRRLNPRDDWVGLTDEERDPIRSKFIGRLHDVADVLAEFEAKLKEKNT